MATTFREEIIGTDSRIMQNTTSDANTLLENLPQVLKDKFELDTKIAESLWIAFVYHEIGFVLSVAWFVCFFLLFSEGKSLVLGCFHSFDFVWELKHD